VLQGKEMGRRVRPAALGGIDPLVLRGGIGENEDEFRERIWKGSGFLGIELDLSRNAVHADVISTGRQAVVTSDHRTDEGTHDRPIRSPDVEGHAQRKRPAMTQGRQNPHAGNRSGASTLWRAANYLSVAQISVGTTRCCSGLSRSPT